MKSSTLTTANTVPPTRMATRRSLLPTLALLVGSILIALLLAEGAYRLISGEDVNLRGMYTSDPVVGGLLTPGFQGSMETAEFRYDVAINDLGMRDGPIGPKLPGTTRILLIGDSFVFGWGAQLPDSIGKQLERQLAAAAPERHYEVLNGGVPGFNTFQEVYNLRRLAPLVSPDIVVLVLFTGDDWFNNEAMNESTRPDGIHENLKRYSALYRFIDRFVINRLKARANYASHQIHPGPEFQAQRERVVALLDEARTVATQQGAEFFVVLNPRYTQIYDDAWSKAAMIYRLGSEDYSPLEPNRSVAAQLAGTGIAYLDLLGPLRDEGKNRLLNFPVDGHWNRDGTEFVASLLAKRINGDDTH